MLAREVALLTPELPGKSNSTLPLQETNYLRHRHLGGNGNTHMDMIGHDDESQPRADPGGFSGAHIAIPFAGAVRAVRP